MKKLLLLCGLCGIIGCSKVNAQTELKVLQWNIWQEGTMVPGGYEAIVFRNSPAGTGFRNVQ